MNVPNFVHEKLVDQNGNLTDGWRQFFTQLNDQLNANFGNKGVVVPQLTTAQISTIETDAINGTLIWDSTTNELKVRLNDGTFHVIQTI